MDEIRCKIEVREVEGKPARLVGVLMPYGERAKDRNEVFDRGSLKWPDGVVLRRQHNREQPILRFTPIEVEGRLTIDAPIPDTTAGRDALAEIRSGLFKGLSVEFRSIKEGIVGGVRRIREAALVGAGLVDSPAYADATVEARAKAVRRASDRHTREFLL